MQVYSQTSTRTTLPRSMSGVSAGEFTQRSTVKAGMSRVVPAAPAPIATARNTKGRMALISEGRDRSHDLFRADNGARVVRHVDVKRGMHLLVRVAGGRVPHHRDLVAKLNAEADRRLHTGVRDESNEDELMDAMLLELQIQIGIGEATGTPMLEGQDVARSRREFAADLATPRPVFEGLVRPGGLLSRRDVLPGLVVARTVSTMQRIADAKPRRSRRIQDLQHVRHTTIRLGHRLQTRP